MFCKVCFFLFHLDFSDAVWKIELLLDFVTANEGVSPSTFYVSFGSTWYCITYIPTGLDKDRKDQNGNKQIYLKTPLPASND